MAKTRQHRQYLGVNRSGDSQWSESVEDYLKHIWFLLHDQPVVDPERRVGGQLLAGRLGVSQASVTSMLKKLNEQKLVDYEPYQGVLLTPAGERIALEVVRHHRLIEAYLAEVLGMPWDEVHEEAEILEHHISERVEQLMAERLGNPKFDPHGHPIPTLKGTMPKRSGSMRSLHTLQPGEQATVRTVRNERSELLRYLTEIGVMPDRIVQVTARTPLGDTVTIVNQDGATHAIGREVAECIDVS
jgi:DtxR family Mn-dependent transcriptional regulator